MAGITYIVDKEGNRTAAVLPLPEYGALLEELLEDAELGRLVRQIPLDQRTKGMEANQFFAQLEAEDAADE